MLSGPGVPAAFVYEQLDAQPQGSWDLAVTALLSPRATQQALAELAAHHLAVRSPTGWTRGAADPIVVARAVGADLLVADQAARYRIERDAWRVRLGSYPNSDISELLRTPPADDGPAGSTRPASWLPVQAQPPPATAPIGAAAPAVTVADCLVPAGVRVEDTSAVDDALAIVLRLLGGTVLAPV